MGAANGDGAPVGRARNARRKGARKLRIASKMEYLALENRSNK